MLTIDEIKRVVSKMGKKYGVERAYLFGSYAKNMANEQSDVDIIIDKGAVRTYDDYCDLKFGIEDALGVDVDLLTMDGVKPRFFELIKNDRILLYGA